MTEDGEWVKSSTTCRAVSLFGSFFNLIKALACLSARHLTNIRFLLLRSSLGSSSFCSSVMAALTPSLLFTFFTSAAEPFTNVLRMVVVPDGNETSLPVPKQSFKIGAAKVDTSTREAKKATEKIKHILLNIYVLFNFTVICFYITWQAISQVERRRNFVLTVPAFFGAILRHCPDPHHTL